MDTTQGKTVSQKLIEELTAVIEENDVLKIENDRLITLCNSHKEEVMECINEIKELTHTIAVQNDVFNKIQELILQTQT